MFCRNCGKELADDAKFCVWCGTQFMHGESEKAPEAAPVISAQAKKNNGRLWGIGAAIVVVLLGIAFIGKEIVKLQQGQEDHEGKMVAEVSTVGADDTEETVPEDTEMQESEEAPESEEPSEAEEIPEIEDTETSDTENPAAENAEISNKEETASETTESTANGSITTVSNWGTPQEYNGDPEGKGPGRIIVKDFDYNDFFGGLSWKGEYWTASNGVEIKVLSIIDGKSTGMIPVPDGKGKDNEPTSPFQIAMAEAAGDNIYKFNADLNVTIPLATYKRADIDINDANLVAYRNAYDYKLYTINGQADLYKPYQYGDPINQRLAVASDGIGEFDKVGGQFWRIRKVNDYWEVRINANLAEFRWDGIHQVLRYLSPDGDSLYQVIYEDWYYGSPVILEYDDWFAVGNSQIYQKDTAGMGYGIYYFK